MKPASKGMKLLLNPMSVVPAACAARFLAVVSAAWHGGFRGKNIRRRQKTAYLK